MGRRPARPSCRCSDWAAPAIDKIESLDQHGLLVRLIPEWAAVRNKPQRNAYHTYTVDRHLLEAAALAAELTDTVERPDLLLVGALLHDIGKGFPATTPLSGWRWCDRMATRMGFAPGDVAVLVDLVRHHLLLPDTATRRDLDDPTTIARVAQAAGNRLTLHLLGRADRGRQPGDRPFGLGSLEGGTRGRPRRRAPTACSQGRDRARRAGPHRGSEPELMDEVRAERAPVGVAAPPQVIVAAPDRPGLFSSVAGALPSTAWTCGPPTSSGENGVAVEVFTVEVARGTWPDTAKLREDLAAVLSDRLAIGERLSERERVYPRRRGSAAHVPGSDVSVDNEASETATVLEVRAPDEIGLLHRITRALFEAGLDVVSARVSTLGEMVVDAFYVTGVRGDPR